LPKKLTNYNQGQSSYLLEKIDDSFSWKAYLPLLISKAKVLSYFLLVVETRSQLAFSSYGANLRENKDRLALGFTIKHLNLLFDSFNSVNNFNYL
jgi:hypothetical protein